MRLPAQSPSGLGEGLACGDSQEQHGQWPWAEPGWAVGHPSGGQTRERAPDSQPAAKGPSGIDKGVILTHTLPGRGL